MSGKATSLISVVLVTDASLTIAGEWHRILSDCVGSITQRLVSEIHPGSEPLRMGYVAYGAAESPEGPIIEKRFFQDQQSLTRDLNIKHTDMGIGRASGTCEIGLSALEAYACALEMFDLQKHQADFQPLKSINLNSEREAQKTYDRHDYIIHIAAAEPDDARRPRHNDSVAYDELNWDSLPREIKKHNIHLCMDLLKPIKRFNDLFDAVSDGSRSTAWFTTSPKHTLLLYGFPAPRNKPSKRPSDVGGSPIQKRAKTAKEVPPPSSPAKANSNSSPYMSPVVTKTPKQAPAVPKPPPTPAAPPVEPKSTPILNAAQPPALAHPPPMPSPSPAPAPAPISTPILPSAVVLASPTPAPAAAPAAVPNAAANAPAQLPRNLPSILSAVGFHTEIRTHPRFEIGMQNPQHRALVEFMIKYDPIYTQQMILAMNRKRAGQPTPPEFEHQIRRLKLFFDLGAAALKRWNAGGPPVNFDEVKTRATTLAAAASGLPGAAAAQRPEQGQAGQANQVQNPAPSSNTNLGPAAQGMLDQMNEISKTNIQRHGILPPANAPAGAGARPPSQPAFPQQQQPQAPTHPPGQQPPQKWTGALIINAPRPNGQPQVLRLEVAAVHQAMSDPMMSTWPQNIDIRIMFNLTFAPKDLDVWFMSLKTRGRAFSIVRIQPSDNPNPMAKEQMRQGLAKIVEVLAARTCLAIASWNIPGKGTVPTAIFTRMPAGAPENHLIAIVFPQGGFDKSDLPAHLANAAAQGQGSPQNPNANAQIQQQQQQSPPSNIGMRLNGRKPSEQEIVAMQRIAKEMNIPWEMFHRLPDAEKAKVVHVYTSRREQAGNNLMGGVGGIGGGVGGIRPGMQGGGMGGMQLQQLQQQQQQRQQQQMQAALLNRAVVPPGAPANAFAGLSASGAGFAGMGGGGGNNVGGLNPGISVGALGGMQPQGANTMGGGFPVSQSQIDSWMQRSAPGR